MFYIDEDKTVEGSEIVPHILERQISYFASLEGLEGLFKHLGDNPWCQIFITLTEGFGEENPRRPFSRWSGIDDDFKDPIQV